MQPQMDADERRWYRHTRIPRDVRLRAISHLHAAAVSAAPGTALATAAAGAAAGGLDLQG